MDWDAALGCCLASSPVHSKCLGARFAASVPVFPGIIHSLLPTPCHLGQLRPQSINERFLYRNRNDDLREKSLKIAVIASDGHFPR